MKKMLLPVAIFMSSAIYAQTYFEDDFSGGLGAWTVLDEDGDGMEWVIADYAAGDGHGNVAASASWDAGAGALTPDNVMVSESIDLSGAAGDVYLTWQVKAQDQDWADENYSVYVATSDDLMDLYASPLSFNEVIGATGGVYQSRLLDVSDLAGEGAVYIAFRHHDVSDMFRLNIDDVMIATLPANDIELLSVSTYPVTEPGDVEITGTVKNNGAEPITSFDLVWTEGGVPHMETITADIAPFATYAFTHSTALTATSGSVYEVSVCASVADDADLENNCADVTITCVEEIPEKFVVGEEKTGTWCGWCPRGTVALEGMESEDNFIGIAVHNGDPMTIASYDTGINTYVPGGYPGAGVDRVIDGDPSDFEAMFNERKDMIPLASIDVSVVDAGDDYEVTVSATFIADLSGDYRLASVITHDRVAGSASGYAQVNYYSGGDYGEMGGYEDLPNPVPAADMVYNHVAVALANDQILGDAGSLPADISAGTTESYTYTIPKGADWSSDWLHFIGMLIDASTGEIINAGQTHLEYTGIENLDQNEFNISLYPNPANEIAQLKLTIEEESNVSVEIYNNIGEVVFVNQAQNLAGGEYIYTVDVNDFAPGIYVVRTTANETVKTVKLSVQ
ncbi:T9SS-dependent choice-of-anchor J family protein [Crocinitomix algicola]|uniref:T9SS-dependent choice-of-anchor J family protein n=1 Tax=Crocinitomix algicola TaxID=1740263 RepID=UPI0008355766|nr:choice-of-anchor J domain-containing protein [Crocinitomix algicola]